MGELVKNKTNELFKQSIKGGAIFGLADGITKVLVLVNTFFILRSLTVYQYGVYKLAFSIFVVTSSLLLDGLNGLVLNEISASISEKKGRATKRLLFEFAIIRLGIGVLSWAFVFFGAEIIAQFYSAGVAEYLKILSFLYIINAVVVVLDTVFKATLNFFISAIRSVADEAFRMLLIFYFVFYSNLGITSLLWTVVISAGLSAVIFLTYFIIKYRGHLVLPTDNKYVLLKMIKGYGKWGIAKGYLGDLPRNLRLWIIKAFISTEAVAIFSVAESLYNVIKKIVPLNVFTVLVPRTISDLPKLKDLYQRGTKYLTLIYSILLVASFLIVPSFVALIFPKYVSSLPYFQIMLFGLIFYSLSITGLISYSLRYQRFLFFFPLIRLVVIAALGFLLVPVLGLWGVTLEYVLGDILIFSISYWYLIWRVPSLKLKFAAFFKYDSQDKLLVKEIWAAAKNKIRFLNFFNREA